MFNRVLGFLRVFTRHVGRDVLRHPILILLNVAAIALGSGVYLAIQTANQSAIAAFYATVDFVSGKAHLEIQGRGIPLNENWWPEAREAPGITAATPLVEGVVTLPDRPGDYLRILGIDLFTHPPFSTFLLREQVNGETLNFESFLATNRGVTLTAPFAQANHLEVGDTFTVLADGRPQALTVIGLIDPENAPPGADSHLAVMDIGWAQELLGQTGSLTKIQLQIEDPTKLDAATQALQNHFASEALSIAAPAQRSSQVQNLLMGFQLNLTALSMISLLVGVFLVFNTVSASVVRRRHELGILRSVGASPFQIRALFLGEALLYGFIGVTIGIGAGVLLAQGLTGAVAQTIRSLYVLVQVEQVQISFPALLTTVVASIGAVLAGAWQPAAEAARLPPIAALTGEHSPNQHRSPLRWLPAAIGCSLAGVFCAWIALQWNIALASFGTAFFALAAAASLAPIGTSLLGRLFRAAARRLPIGASRKLLVTLGCDHLLRSLHRNAVTVAALMAAVAMMIGVATMIHAFRGSVNTWIEGTMRADLFLTSSANEVAGAKGYLPAELLESLETITAIDQIDTYLEWSAEVNGAPTMVALVEPDNKQSVQIVRGNADEARAAFRQAEAVMITESLARKRGFRVGDSLTFALGNRTLELPVAAIYRDYTRDQGMVLFPDVRYREMVDDPRVQSVAIHLLPGTDLARASESIETLLPGSGRYLLYSRQSLRERVIEIFDQTFAVTYLLRTIAIVVAALGVVLTLSILVMERTREYGILRSIGMSRGQLMGASVAEAVVLGLAAACLGVFAGLLLAVILTYVVNVAFFGWTIVFRVPWTELIFAPLWIVLTAAAAALWPAWKAAHADIGAAVRSE